MTAIIGFIVGVVVTLVTAGIIGYKVAQKDPEAGVRWLQATDEFEKEVRERMKLNKKE